MDEEILALRLSPRDPTVTYSAYKNNIAELQSKVGGFIQSLPLGGGMMMLFDEDGIHKNLPSNPLASMFAFVATGDLHNIYGTVFVVGTDPPDLTDVPNQAWDVLHRVMQALDSLMEGGG